MWRWIFIAACNKYSNKKYIYCEAYNLASKWTVSQIDVYRLHNGRISCRARRKLDGMTLESLYLLFCPSPASLTCVSAKASWQQDGSHWHWHKQREVSGRKTTNVGPICSERTRICIFEKLWETQTTVWPNALHWWYKLAVHYWDWCSLDSSAAGERKLSVWARG